MLALAALSYSFYTYMGIFVDACFITKHFSKYELTSGREAAIQTTT